MSGDKPPRPGSRSPTGRQVLRERPERALDIAEAVCDPIPVRQGRAAMGLKIREEPRSLPEEETGIALAHHGGERGEGALRKEDIAPSEADLPEGPGARVDRLLQVRPHDREHRTEDVRIRRPRPPEREVLQEQPAPVKEEQLLDPEADGVRRQEEPLNEEEAGPRGAEQQGDRAPEDGYLQ